MKRKREPQQTSKQTLVAYQTDDGNDVLFATRERADNDYSREFEAIRVRFKLDSGLRDTGNPCLNVLAPSPGFVLCVKKNGPARLLSPAKDTNGYLVSVVTKPEGYFYHFFSREFVVPDQAYIQAVTGLHRFIFHEDQITHVRVPLESLYSGYFTCYSYDLFPPGRVWVFRSASKRYTSFLFTSETDPKSRLACVTRSHPTETWHEIARDEVRGNPIRTFLTDNLVLNEKDTFITEVTRPIGSMQVICRSGIDETRLTGSISICACSGPLHVHLSRSISAVRNVVCRAQARKDLMSEHLFVTREDARIAINNGFNTLVPPVLADIMSDYTGNVLV